MKTILLTVFLFLTFTSTDILAARPSITSLQQQINQLQAELNSLQSEVDQQPRQLVLLDSNDKRVGDVLAILAGSDDFNPLRFPEAIINIRTDKVSQANLTTTNARLVGVGLRGAQVLWDQPNCEGNVLGVVHTLEPSGVIPLVRLAGLVGQFSATDTPEFVVYIPDPSVPSALVSYNSRSGGDYVSGEMSCAFPPGSVNALPVIKEVIDLSEEAATWVSPLRIEVAP